LGVLTFGDSAPLAQPPRAGRLGQQSLRRAVQRLAGPLEPDGSGPTALGAALHRVNRLARRRGLVVVVSDFRFPAFPAHATDPADAAGAPEWRRPLVQLAARHDVVAVEVRDPREGELPDLGAVTFVDPETGRELRVDTGDRRLRERFAGAAAAERAQVARHIQTTGAAHVVLSTSGDWLRHLAGFLLLRRTSRTSRGTARAAPAAAAARARGANQGGRR
jgi:hypothetical protein